MNNRNFKDFIRVASSQFIGMLISIIRSLILPIYLGVMEYGYFQSYLFYISLLPVITLGYNDGVYLKYGKYEYDSLPFDKLSSSNYRYTIVSLILSILIFFLANLFVDDKNLLVIIFLSCSYGFFLSINGLLMQILQVTRQFQLYSRITILTKVSSLLLVLAVLCLKGSYLWIILADLLSFAVITFYLIYKNKQLFVSNNLQCGKIEYYENIRSGFPLLIAGLIGLFYLGAGRLIVQIFGGIDEFSFYSFSLSIASFVSIAISSVSLVVYPIVSRYSDNEKLTFYATANSYVRILIVFIPVVYYCAYFLIDWLYIDYKSVLEYLNIVFIMMYIQSYIYILQNTYYKALRLERNLFLDNLLSISLLFAIGIPFYYFTRQLFVVAIVTLLAMLIRYFVSTWRLSKVMNIRLPYNIVELIFSFVFVIITHLWNANIFGIIIIIIISLFYCIYNKSYFRRLIKSVI